MNSTRIPKPRFGGMVEIAIVGVEKLVDGLTTGEVGGIAAGATILLVVILSAIYYRWGRICRLHLRSVCRREDVGEEMASFSGAPIPPPRVSIRHEGNLIDIWFFHSLRLNEIFHFWHYQGFPHRSMIACSWDSKIYSGNPGGHVFTKLPWILHHRESTPIGKVNNRYSSEREVCLLNLKICKLFLQYVEWLAVK